MSYMIYAVLCLLVLHTVNVQAARVSLSSPFLSFPKEVDLGNEPPPATKYEWGCKDYDPKTNSSLFAFLWCNSQDLAERSYETPFIQGIKSGLLNPVKYSAFDIQDAWWIRRASNSYGWVCIWQSCDKDQEDFFTRLSRVYLEYVRGTIKPYNVPVSTVLQSAASHAYARYESTITSAAEAKYSVALVMPVFYLMPALLQRLKAEGALKPTNIYSFWIEAYLETGTTFEMAKALLDNEAYEYDKQRALKIFRTAMKLGADFFAASGAATPGAAS